MATPQGVSEVVSLVQDPKPASELGASVQGAQAEFLASIGSLVPQAVVETEPQQGGGRGAINSTSTPLPVPSNVSQVIGAQNPAQLVLSANAAQAAAISGASVLGSRSISVKNALVSGSSVGASGMKGATLLGDVVQDSTVSVDQDLSSAVLDAQSVPVNPARAFFAAQSGVKTRSSDNNIDSVPAPVLKGVVQNLKVTVDSNSSGGENQQSGQSLNQKEAKPESTLPSPVNLHGAQIVEQSDVPKSASLSGTRGAIRDSVPKETSPIRLSSEETTQNALSDSGPSVSAVVDHSVASTNGAGLQSSVTHGASESRPAVLPSAQVRTPGEAWRVIQDAIQRARSENPSHLAVEVRLEDGSSMGVELRLSSSGLQASFRSESQFLLKAIETNWNSFLSKESGDLKVASAVFEGRGGFGDLSNGGSNSGSTSGERRQQFEDNAASATLRFGNDGASSNSSPRGTSSSSAERPAAPGEMALYA
jgi:hypothetical protein